eukprot:1152746-Pelagomonas_calceolata.AAC.5
MVQTPKHRAPSGQQLWQSHQTSSSSDVCMCMCPERGGGALGKGGGCTTLTHSPLFSTAAAAPPGTPAHPPVVSVVGVAGNAALQQSHIKIMVEICFGAFCL